MIQKQNWKIWRICFHIVSSVLAQILECPSLARLGTFTARLARTHHYANTHFKGLSGNQASAATNFSFIISWWLKHSEPKEGFKIGSIHLLQKYMYFLTNFEKKFSLWSKFFYSCVSLAQVHYCIWKAPESCA